MATLNFAAQVSQEVGQVKAELEAVFRESAQRVLEEMNTPIPQGGNVPVDTGFLWHSLQASTTAMPQMTATGAKSASYSFDSGPVVLTIAGATLGDAIYAGYTAVYARRMNYGFTGQDAAGRSFSQSGHLFVEKAAQRWPAIVAEVEAELRKIQAR